MLLGAQAHWTVGLVPTLISLSIVIAADTFAFLGCKIYRFIVVDLCYVLVHLTAMSYSCILIKSDLELLM